MGKYVPTAITFQDSGLVKNRDAFVLSDDAYQDLENIYQFRGRLKRREGYDLLGRLRRDLTAQALANADGTNDYNVADVLSAFTGSQPNRSFAKEGLVVTFDPGGGNETTFTDQGDTTFLRTAGTAYDLDPAKVITGISKASSAVILVTGHTFVIGNKVYIDGVLGMKEINNHVVNVTAISAGVSITVNLDTTAFSTYASAGTANGSFVNYDTAELNFTFLTGSVPAGAITVEAAYGYYPSLPVMGIPQRELDTINAEQTLAFDTTYSYQFSSSSNKFTDLTSAAAVTWTGSDSDFFSSMNYWRTADNQQYFWATNFYSGDPIRIYDGVSWFPIAPTTDGTNEMHQCRILIPYKGRVVALNTREGGTLGTSNPFPQRARWSQVGAPVSSVNAGTIPTALLEWKSDVKGRGGYVDCPTNEHIISAEFIRDTLVVGFERSTWLLRYTGNEILPFAWERINKELGCESPFAMVAFDRGVLAVGDKAIITCDGNSVQRIDEDIPDEVFNMHNTQDPSAQIGDGLLRVHGTRDYFERLVLWTYGDQANASKFPDRMLVFNYQNQTWAVFTDSFTCFGKYQRFNDVTWADLAGTDWSEASFAWVSNEFQSQFPSIVAGNQRGYVLNLNKKVSNSESLPIDNIVGGASAVRLTIKDHNLQEDEFIEIDDILGTGKDELNNRIFNVTKIDANTIDLQEKPRTVISAITLATEAVVTAIGHTFTVGQHFYIDRVVGMTEINGLNGKVLNVNGNLVTIDVDSTLFTAYTSAGLIQNLNAAYVPVFATARTYMGCGNAAKVVGFKARSKKFNMLAKGKKNFLGHIDFLTEVTQRGEVACQIFTDYDQDTPVNDKEDGFFNTVFSTEVEQFSQPGKHKEFHRFYCPTDSQFLEYNLTLNDRQMNTPGIVNSQVLVDAIILYSEQSGRLVE